MKSYPTEEEIKSIINLILSSDEESVKLGLDILLSKSFRTDSILKTAVYNAQLLKSHNYNVVCNYNIVYYYFSRLIKALNRYLNKLNK